MKGIILAGGKGSRLYPMTKAVSKPLIPIYDKPMIYYSLSVLLQAGIRELIVITAPADLTAYQRLLGDGSQLGVRIDYGVQKVPKGIADAFLIAEDYIAGDRSCLVLGDNLFYGANFANLLRAAASREKGATIFGYPVKNASAYGVVTFDRNQKVLSIEEKPKRPKSRYAVPGLYFYDDRVCELAKKVKPSKRGELEITDLNRMYLEEGTLNVVTLGRGYAWLDTGTVDALSDATEFVKVIETRQGIKISAIEEIAYRNGWISEEQLWRAAEKYGKSAYGAHLKKVVEHKIIY